MLVAETASTIEEGICAYITNIYLRLRRSAFVVSEHYVRQEESTLHAMW